MPRDAEGEARAAFVADREARRRGHNPDHVWNALIVVMIFGLIGARLYHVVSAPAGSDTNLRTYLEDPIKIVNFWSGGGLRGLGIFGALLGGAFGLWLYTRFAHLRFAEWADICVLGAGIAGVSAALEAARLGRRTVMVDAAPSLGGQAVGSIIGTIIGLYTHGPEPYQITHGIADELIADLTQEGSLNRRVSMTGTITFQYDEVRLARWIERKVEPRHQFIPAFTRDQRDLAATALIGVPFEASSCNEIGTQARIHRAVMCAFDEDGVENGGHGLILATDETKRGSPKSGLRSYTRPQRQWLPPESSGSTPRRSAPPRPSEPLKGAGSSPHPRSRP